MVANFIPIKASAQLIPTNNKSLSYFEKPWKHAGSDSTTSSIPNEEHPIQVFALVDISSAFLFQMPGIGGQLYVKKTLGFGFALNHIANRSLIDNNAKINGESLNLALYGNYRPSYFGYKLVLTYVHHIKLIERNDENEEVFEISDLIFPVSIGYFHDIGKKGGFILQYECHFVSIKKNSLVTTRSPVMPGIKILYQIF